MRGGGDAARLAQLAAHGIAFVSSFLPRLLRFWFQSPALCFAQTRCMNLSPFMPCSGQVVRGAPKDKDRERRRGGDQVGDIFKGARAAGAEQGTDEDMLGDDDDDEEGGRFRAFSGSARTLAGGRGAGQRGAAAGAALQLLWGCVPAAQEWWAAGGLASSQAGGRVAAAQSTRGSHPAPAGGDAVPPQQQARQRGPERRVVKVTFYANGIFTGARAGEGRVPGVHVAWRRLRQRYVCTPAEERHRHPWAGLALASRLLANALAAQPPLDLLPRRSPSSGPPRLPARPGPARPASPPSPLPRPGGAVDGGEARNMHDPASLPFMEAIMRGQLPPELDPGDPNIQVGPPYHPAGWRGRSWLAAGACSTPGWAAMEGVAIPVWANKACPLPSPCPPLPRRSPQVTVNLLRRDEDYTPPAQPKVKAFSGTGHKLSGDDDAGASAAAPPAPPPDVVSGTVVWEGADASLPTTSIQLRLADGSRLRAEFNLSHTVADIRRCAGSSLTWLPPRPSGQRVTRHDHHGGLPHVEPKTQPPRSTTVVPARRLLRPAGSSAPRVPTWRAALSAWPPPSRSSSWTTTRPPLRGRGLPTASSCRGCRAAHGGAVSSGASDHRSSACGI